MHLPIRSMSAAFGPTLGAHPGLSRASLAAMTMVAGCVAAAVVVVAGPVLAIFLMVGVVIVCAAVLMPGFLFAAYILIPFYKGAVQPYFPIDITIVLAAACVLQIIPVLLDGRPRGISRAGVALWIGLGALVVAGTLYAPDQGIALSTAVSFWALVILPLLAAGLRVGSDPRFVRQFLWSFFVMGVITVVLGLAQLSGVDRLIVLGMNTIQVGRAALLVPLLGISFVLLEGRPSIRAATIVLIPAAFVVALASGSRGPLLVLLLLAGLAVIRQLVRRRALNRRLVTAVGGAVVATVCLFALASALLPARSVERFTLFADFVGSILAGDPLTSTGDTSSGARVRLFGLAVTMFTDHPLLGAGPAGFQVLSPRYVGPYWADRYPHNALLQFAAEFGLVGVTLFVVIVALAITRRIPPGAAWWSVRAAFAFFLLNSMLTGNILEDRMMWSLLSLVLLARVVAPVAASDSPRDASTVLPAHEPARTPP